ALHLAQFAEQQGAKIDGVRAVIVAGEPGGSIPATRALIEKTWNARVFDHSGMTEIGPLAIECQEQPGGLHILEDDFYAEVIDPATGAPIVEHSLRECGVSTVDSSPDRTRGASALPCGELVLTNLGRIG